MIFKGAPSVTELTIPISAGLRAEVGVYLSVLIVSPPPLGDRIPEWPRQRAQVASWKNGIGKSRQGHGQ
ncbi:hypothetical protein [Sinorhizobium meliloti]|uniref:hypothetical protein n=1 Tax=Rhizobium meliloti TaxID=382 RepID=UPI0012698287|nr:hypothetical protein [Sinorhizobium meliloti]